MSSARSALACVPAAGGILVLAAMFRNVLSQSGGMGWNSVGLLSAGAALAFATAAILRYALAPLIAPVAQPAAGTDPNAVERGRIGPVILAVGSAAILLLALGLIVAFTLMAYHQASSPITSKLDTLLMGVFTAVLPVFATWVGTVLAFYFTKESFAQAARSALDQSAASGPVQTVTDPARMIPYDGIGKLVVDRASARKASMDDVIALFNDNTTRVIVFDRSRQPVFVIRRKLVPEAWQKLVADRQETGMSVNDYLQQNGGATAMDAVQFGFIASSSTVDQARAQMFQAKCVDLFVTDTGQKTGAVIGWLPEDRLQ